MTDHKEFSEVVVANTDMIVRQPEHFFAAQRTTLEARISEVSIPDEKLKNIRTSKGKKVVRDAVLGTFLIGRIAKTILDWNEGVDKEIKEAKKTHLLEKYFNVSEQNEKAISQLKSKPCRS